MDAAIVVIQQLKDKIKRLESQNKRNVIANISEQVTPDNPYSRLMALETMGVVQDYRAIRKYTVAIVGVGGIGSLAAEMLTRCGIGSLIIFDNDTVEWSNMNRRSFYRPCHVGMAKTLAARETLLEINPDVQIEVHNVDVSSVQGFQVIKAASQAADVILSCVDNYQARMAINQCCLDLDKVWFESGVSENALSCHIQWMIPGITACYNCAPPIMVAEEKPEQLKRENVCAASLPTTMSIVAGILVNNVLKYEHEKHVTQIFVRIRSCFQIKYETPREKPVTQKETENRFEIIIQDQGIQEVEPVNTPVEPITLDEYKTFFGE